MGIAKYETTTKHKWCGIDILTSDHARLLLSIRGVFCLKFLEKERKKEPYLLGKIDDPYLVTFLIMAPT